MGQRGRPSLEVGRRVNGAKCCCTETLGAFYSRYIRDSLLTKSKMAGQETFHVNLTPGQRCQVLLPWNTGSHLGPKAVQIRNKTKLLAVYRDSGPTSELGASKLVEIKR